MINVSASSGMKIFLKALRFDTTVWIASLAAAALLLLYASPILSPAKIEYFAELGVPMAIGIALFSVLHGLSRIQRPEERYFWFAVAAALACWFAGRLIYFFHVPTPRPGYLYLAYYIAMFIALDQRPHLKSGWALGAPRSVFATAGSLILTAGFLSYFVLVPSISAAQAPEILNQHYVYLFMDALVGARFFLLHRSCRSKRWRHIYALLALSGALVVVEDLRDLLYYAGIVPQAAGGWLDIFYYLPHATLIVATRLRNVTAETGAEELEDWRQESSFRWALPGLLWAFALLPPLMHLSLSAMGLLDVTYRNQLSLTVIFFTIVLTALAVIQIQFAERQKNLFVSQLAMLRRTERELRDNKMSALRRLSGGIAHRLNNLLQIIVGYGQMLLRRPETDWQQRLQIHKMLDASTEASSLTDQLLAFSRSKVLRPRLVEVTALLKDRPQFPEGTVGSDIAISRTLHPAEIWISADPAAIFDALEKITIFVSARMPRGSELTLATRSIRLKLPSVLSRCRLDRGSYAVISLRCGGWTLTKRDLKHLFEPFALDSGPLGLALATAHAIIDQSGGHIGATEGPSRGVEFQIFFPQSDPPAAAAGEPAAKPPVNGRRLRCVLLAEDNKALREMLRDYLRAVGLDVLAASDGEQALEMCHRHHATIDLLLTDVVMPRMGGFDLAHQISVHYPEIETLFMSAHLGESLQRHPDGDWQARYLAKPFELRQLREKMLELFPNGLESPPETNDDD